MATARQRVWATAQVVVGALAALVSMVSASHGLSFSIPSGRYVVDIDFATTGGTATYDDKSETLVISADVGRLRLDDGSTIESGGGLDLQIVFSVELVGSISAAGTIISGTYASATADFVIIDSPGPSESLIYAADFDGAGGSLNILTQAFTGFVLNGTLSGNYTRDYGTALDSNELADVFSPIGNLSVQLSNFSPSTSTALRDDPADPDVNDRDGLNSFTAQPTVDLTPGPIPEPATGLLLAGGLIGLSLATRRRQGPMR